MTTTLGWGVSASTAQKSPSGAHTMAAERGSVTAELAIALPAIALVIVFALGIGAIGTQQIMLHNAVSHAARLLGRGENQARAASIVSAAVPGSTIAIESDDTLVCVSGSVQRLWGLVSVPIHARGCSLAGGK
ncbi:TadE/TadG family type IV pilus assembly protein [Microbacterium sp. YY-01]|uniref:TadE/TadG family type IV pilus assembly protein n=1 Tax=Microbacterium sp. YY-01 TaxID=3421634 RepID=UPI003D1797C3